LVSLVTVTTCWTEPYLAYFEDQTLPAVEVEEQKIVRRAKSFTIINNELYKRSGTGVF
jgi:hypothetical protein